MSSFLAWSYYTCSLLISWAFLNCIFWYSSRVMGRFSVINWAACFIRNYRASSFRLASCTFILLSILSRRIICLSYMSFIWFGNARRCLSSYAFYWGNETAKEFAINSSGSYSRFVSSSFRSWFNIWLYYARVSLSTTLKGSFAREECLGSRGLIFYPYSSSDFLLCLSLILPHLLWEVVLVLFLPYLRGEILNML